MSSLTDLATEIGVDERTLRRAAAQGTLRAERLSPRKLLLAPGEERYLRRHWRLLSVATASAASAAALPQAQTDPGLRQLLGEIDPARIEATITRLVQFGTRHTSSSQTDPNRGIGAATSWVVPGTLVFATVDGEEQARER